MIVTVLQKFVYEFLINNVLVRHSGILIIETHQDFS